MEQNITLVNFKVESEAYEAFTKLSNKPVKDKYTINQMVLVNKEDGKFLVDDIFDSGRDTRDDTVLGGVIGGLVGILGGPIGFLLFGSLGALIGNTIDVSDATENFSLIERVGNLVKENETAIILLVEEENYGIDAEIEKYDFSITRFNACEVQYEVEKAKELEKEMHKEAKRKLREEKTGEAKGKIEELKEKMSNEFEELKEKFKNK